MMVAESSFYVTGGTVRHDAPSYVERDADTDLYEGLKRGEFCYVLTSRQMGKSSLMNHTAVRLRDEGFAVATLDLAMLGQNLTIEQWYYGLLSDIGQQLHLSDELRAFWRANLDFGPLQRWIAAIREVVLPGIGIQASGRSGVEEESASKPERLNARTPERPVPLVIFIDEIDTVRSLPFSTDELFAGIRECYNRRTADAEFARLTFCLLGVTTPTRLIQNTATTPFNIGKRIELTDFTTEEAAPLALGLAPWAIGVEGTAVASTQFSSANGQRLALHAQRPTPIAQCLLERILYWTGGHPYLTQRLCRAVADANSSSPEAVDLLCEQMFLTVRAQEQDDNLVFVQDQMLRAEGNYLSGEETLSSLLDLYGQICRGRRVRDEETNSLLGVMRLAGITRAVQGCVQVRNRIYAHVFDRTWVALHMPDAELRRQRAAFRRGLLRASALAALILVVVGSLAVIASHQAQLARDNARLARRSELRANQSAAAELQQRRRAERLLYAADMNLAQQALDEGDLGRARELVEKHEPRAGEEDLRGFEWRYLWQLCQGNEWMTLTGHQDRVYSVAFSPDGRTLASASYDGTVKLWDMATKRELAPLRQTDAAHPHRSAPASLAFSPDGKMLAVGSHDNAVWLWDVTARRCVAILKGHKEQVWSVAFSPDGKTLASKSSDNNLKLWDVSRRRCIRDLQGPHPSRVGGLAFSPDGKTLAWGSKDNGVTLWDVARQQVKAILSGHLSPVYCLAFTPDGKALATGSFDTTIKLWSLESRREAATLQGHQARVMTVAFSPDGKSLASSSLDTTVRLWDIARKQEVAILRGHLDGVFAAAFSPDGRFLASGSADKTVRLWRVATRQGSDVLLGPPGAFLASPLAFSPNGNTLALASDHGTVSLWDVAARQEVGSLPGHMGVVHCVAYSPDGTLLASASEDRTVKLWDIPSRRELKTFHDHAGKVWSVAFSPDGKLLVSGGADAIMLWDVSSRRRLARMEYPRRQEPYWTAFSPDGKTLAEGGWPNLVKLRDVSSRQIVATLDGPRAMGSATVAFTPDGKTLASGGWDRIVRLWDVTLRKPTSILKGHRDAIDTLAFSPDGTTLASAGQDNVVKLWNMAVNQEVVTLKGHQREVGAVAFSPDGRTLASRSIDGVVRLWGAPTFAEIVARQRASLRQASR